jgi:uncharacterized protein
VGKKVTIRVVIDTNVLISCLLFSGRVSYLRDLWLAGKIIPMLSKETFDEFQRVLAYPKFSLTSHEIRAIIDYEILPCFDVIEPGEPISGVCRDPHDDKFLTIAAYGNAAYIVTGDRDLLELRKFRSTKIVTPQEFQAIVGQTG